MVPCTANVPVQKINYLERKMKRNVISAVKMTGMLAFACIISFFVYISFFVIIRQISTDVAGYTIYEIDENGKAHDIETVEKAPDSIAENQGYREVRTDMPQAAVVLMSILQVICGLGIVFCTVGSVIARDAARDRNDVDFNGAKYDPLRGLKTGALFAVVPFILYAVCLIMRLSSPTAAAAKSYYWFYRWIVMCPVKPIVDIFTKNAAIMADASVVSIAFSGVTVLLLVAFCTVMYLICYNEDSVIAKFLYKSTRKKESKKG